MDRLTNAFDGAVFAAEQITQAVHRDRPNPTAVQQTDYLIETLRKFREGLAQRGIEDFYERDVALLDYPLAELKKFLEGKPTALENITGAHIFAKFVHESIRSLQGMAEEIDADNAA